MIFQKWPKAAFVAGDLTLDFLNTVDSQGRTANHDRLTSYAAALTWSLAAGLIEVSEYQEILATATSMPFPAEQALVDLVKWREATHRVFVAISQKVEPSTDDWKTVEISIQNAISIASLSRNEVGFARWKTPSNAIALTTVMQRLALSLNELLSDELVAKIKKCEGCTWFFVDMSKGFRRRWCSMTTCGNRAKAQRLHQTKKPLAHSEG